MPQTIEPTTTGSDGRHAAGSGSPDVEGHANGAGRPESWTSIEARTRHAESLARSFGLFGAFALLVSLAALLAVAFKLDGEEPVRGASASAVNPPAPVGAYIEAITPAAAADSPEAKGIEFEPYRRVDPALPAVPAGPVKRFRVDVYEHVTQVSADKAPTRVWGYGVNGTFYRGTGASPPLVVNEGDRVEITLVNGASERMNVTFPHSIDFHSSEVAPNEAFKTIAPGEKHIFSFVARHPGVYMYHCATQPVLMHTGAGMVGMMVVKPRDLAPVDRELFLNQQEFYIGEPGKDPSMAKMEAKNPDVIAFNGFGAQYQEKPIEVRRGERIRMYVLNAGPSLWSAFHVIGTVFDRTVIDGALGHDAQTVNLAPSQGGWVEFTLDSEGTYPFVTHGFGDMVRGAVGALTTEAPPAAAAGHAGA
jgi:nitrite reductase (NO-forming)